MSRVFQAMRKAKGEAASLALPMIDQAGRPSEETDRIESTLLPANPFLSRSASPEIRTDLTEQVRAEALEKIVVFSNPSSSAADKFRLLRLRLRVHWTARKLKSILVTSPLQGDGKTTVAMNLATILTEERTRRVLLIDADLHRGSVEDQLSLLPQPGFVECLRDEIEPFSAIRRIEPLGFNLLCSSRRGCENPAEILQPNRISKLIQTVSPFFDWIIFDSPPVLPVSDAVSFIDHTDAALLVVRAGVTPLKDTEQALALIGRNNVLGLVINGMENDNTRYSRAAKNYRINPAKAHSDGGNYEPQ